MRQEKALSSQSRIPASAAAPAVEGWQKQANPPGLWEKQVPHGLESKQGLQ